MFTSTPKTFDMTPWPQPRKVKWSQHPSRVLRERKCRGNNRLTTKRRAVQ